MEFPINCHRTLTFAIILCRVLIAIGVDPSRKLSPGRCLQVENADTLDDVLVRKQQTSSDSDSVSAAITSLENTGARHGQLSPATTAFFKLK